QAERLYEVVRDFAQLKGHENVYDLYTGIGSIACFVADSCERITGIEEIEAAIKDAHQNAELNGIKNATFYAGDVKDILTESFIDLHGKPDLLITDPPRAGMHKDVVATLRALQAPRMVYVSCNPATQARDLALLSDLYEVTDIQPVDMFPHTHHIENVVGMTLKSNL
ncbi:MAG: methyltransferase domain-containing protein, partial [Bacteroidota bacterium]